jgi:hypothetical protein
MREAGQRLAAERRTELWKWSHEPLDLFGAQSDRKSGRECPGETLNEIGIASKIRGEFGRLRRAIQ